MKETPSPADEHSEFADILGRIITGEELTVKIGNIGINNTGLPHLVGFDYYTDPATEPAATFVFAIEKAEDGTSLKFINTHRIVHKESERRKGIGTQALTKIEEMVTIVA